MEYAVKTGKYTYNSIVSIETWDKVDTFLELMNKDGVRFYCKKAELSEVVPQESEDFEMSMHNLKLKQ